MKGVRIWPYTAYQSERIQDRRILASPLQKMKKYKGVRKKDSWFKHKSILWIRIKIPNPPWKSDSNHKSKPKIVGFESCPVLIPRYCFHHFLSSSAESFISPRLQKNPLLWQRLYSTQFQHHAWQSTKISNHPHFHFQKQAITHPNLNLGKKKRRNNYVQMITFLKVNIFLKIKKKYLQTKTQPNNRRIVNVFFLLCK